jgi:hypothetical protein
MKNVMGWLGKMKMIVPMHLLMGSPIAAPAQQRRASLVLGAGYQRVHVTVLWSAQGQMELFCKALWSPHWNAESLSFAPPMIQLCSNLKNMVCKWQ